ncbi:hypothetical protein [Glaciimonas immobilis]|uniref:Uncharacterized protein n=1 Tax=Glaciimonas immobilis TaxID=728004 RepID=A0A840RQ15_9BURK|nr:hypothetical protein [Glaciimonas immobilis]KAF3999530.1 hypothetical protein HAV38_06360 [Glaciimonas immobilis]MBB5199068.1 hypothetical protein [Glaciimonas immobilis]
MNEPKNISMVVDGERYRTDTSYLLASDEKSTFLFRASNSNYFVQRESGKDSLEVLSPLDAEKLYKELPKKSQGLVASFPRNHGGIGMDTSTSYDD